MVDYLSPVEGKGPNKKAEPPLTIDETNLVTVSQRQYRRDLQHRRHRQQWSTDRKRLDGVQVGRVQRKVTRGVSEH